MIGNNYAPHIENRPFDAYDGDEDYIFVSYAHADADIVFNDLKMFHDRGFNIWYDEGINSGRGWQEVVEESLINSSLLVVFLSDNAIESPNVREEIFLAIDENIAIIPIYLEETELKYGLRLKLSSIQSILKYEMSDKEYARQFVKDFERLGFECRKGMPDPDFNTTDILPNSFEFLNDLIAKSSDEIVLKDDIDLSEGEEARFRDGISIDRDNLTIDGNNHSIDAQGKAPILNISSKNVVIKNLCFKNAHSADGAVLNAAGASSYFENCRFIDNASVGSGGALSNHGEIRLKDCCFESNTSTEDGGAVTSHDKSTLTIENSAFKNNSSGMKGGAIRCRGNVKISDSLFEGNVSKKSGGAICVMKRTLFELNCSKFIGNTSHDKGGVILNWANTTISGCEFYNNHSFKSGGVISGQKNSLLNIHDSVFKNNSSDMKGGVALNWGDIGIFDSIFESNTSKDSGAVINTQRDGFIRVARSRFTGNSSAEKGGVIITFANADFADSTFKSNVAQSHGGAINIQDEINVKIKNCGFENNCAHGKGGAILNWGNVDLINCQFESNSSKDDGGAINSQEHGFLKLTGVEFIANHADDLGGAIANVGKLKVNSTNFRNNVSEIEGGAIYNKSKGILKGSNLEFAANKANNGGAIYSIKSSAVDLKHTEFSGNAPNDLQYFE